MLLFKKVNGYFLGRNLGIWHTHYDAPSGVRTELEAVKNAYGIDFTEMRVNKKI